MDQRPYTKARPTQGAAKAGLTTAKNLDQSAHSKILQNELAACFNAAANSRPQPANPRSNPPNAQ
jgi:hypothetical protein